VNQIDEEVGEALVVREWGIATGAGYLRPEIAHFPKLAVAS
jgi:hypothetical protein